jgi:hypothetical protein
VPVPEQCPANGWPGLPGRPARWKSSGASTRPETNGPYGPAENSGQHWCCWSAANSGSTSPSASSPWSAKATTSPGDQASTTPGRPNKTPSSSPSDDHPSHKPNAVRSTSPRPDSSSGTAKRWHDQRATGCWEADSGCGGVGPATRSE